MRFDLISYEYKLYNTDESLSNHKWNIIFYINNATTTTKSQYHNSNIKFFVFFFNNIDRLSVCAHRLIELIFLICDIHLAYFIYSLE